MHSVAHSIRQEGAALRTVVSSTARTTVHGAAGREAVRIGCRCRTPPLPESTLGTPDDAKDTKGVHSVAHSIRQHGALLRTVVSSTAVGFALDGVVG